MKLQIEKQVSESERAMEELYFAHQFWFKYLILELHRYRRLQAAQLRLEEIS